eukprot:XP_014788141.1 PREDICTED: uncharacterized protein LOC106882098 [Octopus bimaculoides]
MFQFPPTNPNKATELLLLLSLFTLATIPTVTVTTPSQQQETIAKYRHFGPGYSFGYPGTPSQSEIFPSRSQVECAMNSLKNRTGFFSYDRVNQLCKTYPENIVLTASNLSSERSFYIRNHWIKVYSISKGAGSDVYRSFLNIGDRALWKVDACIGIYCPNFFRHSILDVWEQIPIHELLREEIAHTHCPSVPAGFLQNAVLEFCFRSERFRAARSPRPCRQASHQLPTILLHDARLLTNASHLFTSTSESFKLLFDIY